MGLGRKLFTIGAMAVGAVAGAVFAPKKGAQLRKDLSKEWNKGGSGIDTLKKTASQMGEDIAQTSKEIYESKKIQEKKEAIKKTASETVKKASTEAKKQYGKLKKKAVKEAKETIDEIEE